MKLPMCPTLPLPSLRPATHHRRKPKGPGIGGKLILGRTVMTGRWVGRSRTTQKHWRVLSTVWSFPFSLFSFPLHPLLGPTFHACLRCRHTACRARQSPKLKANACYIVRQDSEHTRTRTCTRTGTRTRTRTTSTVEGFFKWDCQKDVGNPSLLEF